MQRVIPVISKQYLLIVEQQNSKRTHQIDFIFPQNPAFYQLLEVQMNFQLGSQCVCISLVPGELIVYNNNSFKF